MSKPGYKTTEFWLTLVTMIVGTLLASGAFGAESTPLRALGVMMDVLGGLGYTMSRTLSKGKDAASAAIQAASRAKQNEAWATVESSDAVPTAADRMDTLPLR